MCPTMGCFPAAARSGTLTLTTTWENLENSGGSQAQEPRLTGLHSRKCPEEELLRQQVSGCLRLTDADACGISLGCDENVLKLMVAVVAQICEYTQNHRMAHFMWVNSTVLSQYGCPPPPHPRQTLSHVVTTTVIWKTRALRASV